MPVNKKHSFQNLILNLQNYWADYGCALLQPLDLEVGAGTLHPATVLRALGKKPWNVAYTQPCRRPADSRYGQNPNRVGYYYQFQTLLKPAPKNIQELFLKSLTAIGIDIKKNDIRFVEDDWENPTVGAAGLGWEVWFNGMEIVQFTYMQQIGGIECEVTPGELTYGLERIAMHIQGVDNIFDLNWNGEEGDKKITYGDVFLENEKQHSAYILEHSNPETLFRHFQDAQDQSNLLLEKELPIPAYEQALKASHLLNMLDARGVISATERASYILRVRDLVRNICEFIVR
ncbi:MAG: glycine--tRNA ligase subunit alpha [Proteobacteria bacterium]|nr:glycine--tRNA ligase subunit alpha [Pseudomonadota bacterium]